LKGEPGGNSISGYLGDATVYVTTGTLNAASLLPADLKEGLCDNPFKSLGSVDHSSTRKVN